MDQNTLVREHREVGVRIIDACLAAGVDLAAAFWAQRSEDGEWLLYLATPEVEKHGIRDAIRAVLAALRDLEIKSQFDILSDLKIIGATNPMTRDILDFQARYPALISTWYRGRRLGQMAINEAYIYRPGESTVLLV